MKRSLITVIIAILLVVIFACWLCLFQVRTTEVAVVTTFGKPSPHSLSTLGRPYFKLPPPIQRVYKFDNRIQSSEFESKFREDLTSDNNPLLTSVYIGWRITDAGTFLQKFPAGIPAVEQQLANLLSTAKSGVIGKHPLSDFISATSAGTQATDVETSKFSTIEDEILAAVRSQLEGNNYGIKIEFLGFRKIGLPEDTTQKVFDRMTAERQVLISRAQNEGEAQAKIIRSDADLRAAKVLAAAQGEALRIQGKGEAEATKYLSAFQQNPELASFLFRLNALEDSLKDKSTLIFDQQTDPFTLFQGAVTNAAAK
jgi:membrane protease subunit HflC